MIIQVLAITISMKIRQKCLGYNFDLSEAEIALLDVNTLPLKLKRLKLII
jgi:hypothetical protein